MPDRENIFTQYSQVVKALQEHFAAQDVDLPRGETLTQFAFTYQAPGTGWLRLPLPTLAPILLNARFKLGLRSETHDFKAKMAIRKVGSTLVCDCEYAGELENEVETVDSAEIVAASLFVQDKLKSGVQGLPLTEVCDALDVLVNAGGRVRLSLDLFLDKVALNQRLSANADGGVRVTSFLFPEAFLSFLDNSALQTLERDIVPDGMRAVVGVFGMSGLVRGDFCTVCGQGQEDLFDKIVTSPVDPRMIQMNRDVLEFRRSEGIWVQPTSWLTPDMLVVSVVSNGDPASATEAPSQIAERLASQRSLLSILFLADKVELQDNRFWVEYKGLGRTRFVIEPDQRDILACCAEAAYGLYKYSFEGLSPDKLAIAQQFLSLMATDAVAFCTKAPDIRDATKKTYERILVDKVKDYFEARQKIQDRIKGAVDTTATDVTGLTRELTSDLYKIAGLILATVIGTLLDPNVTVLLGFLAALGIATYLATVIFFHLSTIKRARELSVEQNEAYIRSFGDTLRKQEVEDFVEDKRLKDANALFVNKSRWADRIYASLLVIALVLTIILFFGATQQTPSASTGAPTIGAPTQSPHP